MHKFHVGQAVTYRAGRGLHAATGGIRRHGKAPGARWPIRISHQDSAEAYERMARESQLQAIKENEALPGVKGKR